jgi:hypothetical protein
VIHWMRWQHIHFLPLLHFLFEQLPLAHTISTCCHSFSVSSSSSLPKMKSWIMLTVFSIPLPPPRPNVMKFCYIICYVFAILQHIYMQ